MLCIFSMLCYYDVKRSKQSFLNGARIEKLHSEQQAIVENLPDAAIIYKQTTDKEAAKKKSKKVIPGARH